MLPNVRIGNGLCVEALNYCFVNLYSGNLLTLKGLYTSSGLMLLPNKIADIARDADCGPSLENITCVTFE